MQKVTITELSEPVQLFLRQVSHDEGVLVEDEAGRACFGIIPYHDASLEERAKARQRLAELQTRVARRMAAAGKTEDELDRALRDDE